jgi:hypothetical protein
MNQHFKKKKRKKIGGEVAVGINPNCITLELQLSNPAQKLI